MGERTRYDPGTFCWVGLATSDPARARAFYTSLFGWQAEDVSAGEAGTYTLLRRIRRLRGHDRPLVLAAGRGRRSKSLAPACKSATPQPTPSQGP
jgi:catechol 2,3-dioxygenase-like lactoylglutathione lyase family enzyme